MGDLLLQALSNPADLTTEIQLQRSLIGNVGLYGILMFVISWAYRHKLNHHILSLFR